MTDTERLPAGPAIPTAEEIGRLLEDRERDSRAGIALSEQEISGRNGWKSTLRISPPGDLPELADSIEEWWAGHARMGTLDCPAPAAHNRQGPAVQGRPRSRRLVMDSVQLQGNILLPGAATVHLGLTAGMVFDGRAEPQDVVWPMNARLLVQGLDAALREALGEAWQRQGDLPQAPRRMARFHHDVLGGRVEGG